MGKPYRLEDVEPRKWSNFPSGEEVIETEVKINGRKFPLENINPVLVDERYIPFKPLLLGDEKKIISGLVGCNSFPLEANAYEIGREREFRPPKTTLANLGLYNSKEKVIHALIKYYKIDEMHLEK